MLCSEIIQVIEAAYPGDAALGFDNVGLLAGDAGQEVSRVLLCLDITIGCLVVLLVGGGMFW